MPKQQQMNARLVEVAVAGDGGNPLPAYPGTPSECIANRCECGTCNCVTKHVEEMTKCQRNWGRDSTTPNQKELNRCIARADTRRSNCMSDCKAICNKGFDPYPPKTQSL